MNNDFLYNATDLLEEEYDEIEKMADNLELDPLKFLEQALWTRYTQQFDTKEIAKMFYVSNSTVRNWYDKGLKHHKKNRIVKVYEKHLISFLKENKEYRKYIKMIRRDYSEQE